MDGKPADTHKSILFDALKYRPTFASVALSYASTLRACIRREKINGVVVDGSNALIVRESIKLMRIDQYAEAATLESAGIGLFDFFLWLSSLDDNPFPDATKETIASSLVSECIRQKESGELRRVLSECRKALDLYSPTVVDAKNALLSTANLSPIKHRYVVSSDTEVSRAIFATSGRDSEKFRITMAATKRAKERLPAAEIICATYNTVEILNFDLDVLVTAFECASQNPLPEGGWGVTFNQLYRAYFKVGAKEKTQKAGIDMLKGSIHRLRNAGFSYLDLSDAVAKGRISVSMVGTTEKVPFLNATVGMLSVKRAAKPQEGIVIYTVPTLYALDADLQRLRNVRACMRLPNMTRSTDIEQRYVFILSRLLMKIGGKTFNDCTIDMVDKWSADGRLEKVGVLRDEHDKKTPLTKDRMEKACVWVEKLLHYWSGLKACKCKIAYRKFRGRQTSIIERFTLFDIDPDVVLETRIRPLQIDQKNDDF